MLTCSRISQNDKLRSQEILDHEIAFIHDPCFSDPHSVAQFLEPDSDKPQLRQDLFEAQATYGGAEFLPDLGNFELLDKEREQLLFRRMNYLKFLANQHRVQIDSDHPDLELMNEIDELLSRATEVRNQILQANLRLVLSIARRLLNRSGNLNELISDGYLTLLKAVEKFDAGRGYRFSTYATHAIQREIYRQYRKLRRDATRTETLVMQEMLEDRSPLEKLAQDEEKHAVWQEAIELIQEELNDRERFILTHRFGIGQDNQPQKLRWIAEKMDLSKERVRQLQNQAVLKLQCFFDSAALD